MALDYQLIKNWKFEDVVHTYSEKDVILYALGIGLGQDPFDAQQLDYVYEKNLKVFPTMGAVLGFPGLWMRDPATGINWEKVVHGEQRMRFYKPFQPAGTVRGKIRVTHVVDKGADKGAIVVVERNLYDESEGSLLATVEQTSFLRGDGGFGAGDAPPEALPKVPQRDPDHVCSLPTLPQSALLYRLNADLNPLHIDPEVAQRAGYPKPILHGLCTYGVAAHAVFKTLCNYDPSRLRRFDARFSAPVYPGETLEVDIWKGQGDLAHFQARAVERDVVVLSNGVAQVQ